MIIKDFQLEKIIKENKKFISILVYGPNEGLVKDQVIKIKQDYLDQGEYEQIYFSGTF